MTAIRNVLILLYPRPIKLSKLIGAAFVSGTSCHSAILLHFLAQWEGYGVMKQKVCTITSSSMEYQTA